MTRWLFLTALLATVGCYSPKLYDGALRCATGPSPCPDGWHCAVDRACWQNGHDPPRPPAHLTEAAGAGVNISDANNTLTLSIGQPLGGTAKPVAPSDHTMQFGVIRDATSP